ncbi:hypothetical protein TCE0_017r04139 [Talaromyces pinophilus]|uniref:Uncharacterized protein n=1 Tax=Talaromyces pinophilus TaxID=128442 RepID=A0A6V8H4H4_TALPI|nr:hypothetical protein TCE0_017r04139 [Talaromyces pinophilus]
MAEKNEKSPPLPDSVSVDNGRHIDERILKHSHDADVALQAIQQAGDGQVIEIDAATNKRLLRIIDWHLMPLMCVVYGMNYLDKTTISYASVMGMKKDLRLVGDDYQWLGSMFYFGYLGWEYPASQLLQRMPLGKYSAICVVLWGLVLSCFAAVENFGGAVAISFNGFGQIVGGAVAYGIAKGTDKNGSSIAPWKIVFLATGLFTICIGLVFLWVIPDNQLNARWLSQEDRVLAVERVRINQQGIGNKHFKMYQFKEALKDPMTWAFAFYALVADIPNGGISNFFSQLIVSFGFTAEQSLLYGIPGGAVEVVALIASGFMGDWLGRRVMCSMGGLVTAMVGVILIIALPLANNDGRLIGYYMTQASPTPFVALLSLISSNVAGYTKKTTVAAIYLISYCVGNIIGPQTFRPKDAPRYVPAEITIVVCYGVCLIDLAFIWWWYSSQNKKKAMIRASEGYAKLENQEWLDLTDGENAEFVYTL